MMDADAIVTGGRVYTVDDAFRIVESLAIKDGKVVAAGSSGEITSRYRAPERIDATGRFVYPGFFDAHSHFLSYGYMSMTVDLGGTYSWAETVARMKMRAVSLADGWVMGRGWEQALWKDKAFPTNELLDEAFPDAPAIAERVDGHALIANSEALRRAGIDASSRFPGGEVVLQNGKPTGALLDAAMESALRAKPDFSRQEKEVALLAAQADCYAVGLTSVADAQIDGPDVELIDALQRSGKLTMAVNAMLVATNSNFERFVAKGPYVTDALSVRTVKLFADGALGSWGAYLLEPYSDFPGRVGRRVDSLELFDEACRIASRFGFQIATHCIGDRAARETLDMYSRYLSPGNDLRWRMEHCQIIDPVDLPRFRKLGVVPSIQTTHATSDMRWAGDRLGPERLSRAYAYKELLAQNGWLANGSDFPVEKINPLFGFYAAVARKDHQGKPEGGFLPENALTRDEALKAMTIWAAKAAFEEKKKGSLESGKQADFVILDRDIMAVPEDQILSSRVIETYKAGKLAYKRG
jgi:predicted amidohydrolase YtcJ